MQLWIWVTLSTDCEQHILVSYNNIWFKGSQEFQRNILILFSESENKASTRPIRCRLPTLHWFLTWLTLWPSRCMWYILQKYQTFSRLCSFTTQVAAILMLWCVCYSFHSVWTWNILQRKLNKCFVSKVTNGDVRYRIILT